MLNGVRERSRLAGPGLVWAAAAIGSGEVVIATEVGAEHGYSFLWALWLGILLKWSIHRGILDLTVLSGRSVVDRWHGLRLGRLVSCYWLVFFLLTITGLSGLLGLTSAALHVMIPAVSANAWAVIVAVGVLALIYFQRYQGFEKIMLTMCLLLVFGVVGSVLVARPDPLDLVREWSLPASVPAGLLLLSLLGWGAGSGPDLILPYSTWVLEKGVVDWGGGVQRPLVPVGTPADPAPGTKPRRVRRIPQVLRIGRIDLGSGYVVAGLVASGFMIAGAAILAPRGLALTDNDVITVLSRILTDSYGAWIFGIFIIGVTAAFLSTFIGVLDGAYLTIHRLVTLLRRDIVEGNLLRGNLWRERPVREDDAGLVADRRRTIGRAASLAVFVLAPLVLLLIVQQPVTLVIIAGLVSAVSMPLLGILVLYSLTRSDLTEHRLSRSYLGTVVVATLLYLVLMVIAIAQLG